MKRYIPVLAAFAVAIATIMTLIATPLTTDRDTQSRIGNSVDLTLKSNETIFAGSLVSLDANGEAVSATDTSGESVVGRAEIKVDNAAETSNDGLTIKVKRGIFLFASATNAITIANYGDIVYVVDDQTVGRTNEVSNNVEAGRIVDVESAGIWVDTRAKSTTGF